MEPVPAIKNHKFELCIYWIIPYLEIITMNSKITSNANILWDFMEIILVSGYEIFTNTFFTVSKNKDLI